MSVFQRILTAVETADVELECYDRRGERSRAVAGVEFADAVRRYRTAFTGWSARSFGGQKVVGLFFKPEETVEFLVATFAAIAEGFAVVPFYPNWPAEVQERYLRLYGVRAVAVGEGFRARVESWRRGDGADRERGDERSRDGREGAVDRVVPVTLTELPPRLAANAGAFPDVAPEQSCAWIFTSGTSGEVPKCTVISERNLAAAVANIERLRFLRPGMVLHSPLSTSHIFAFTVVLGLLAVKPRRVLFSDVQYLVRLPQERTGKVDGVILVPIVLNRLRNGFYEKLVRGTVDESPAAKLPERARGWLKRLVQYSEEVVMRLEAGRADGLLRWPVIALTRRLLGRRLARRLGSPEFVVVGGAKPSLSSMAFLNVMGMRCLQGWGMTETTGALAVCDLDDRYRGAFGTCGRLFPDTEAEIDDGELIVRGPQVAEGYLEPDGTFTPFHGVKRTGDCAEFDPQGRLQVTGKASDRITLTNGLNYNPLTLEETLAAADLRRDNLLDAVVVVGDGQARLGCVFFLRDPARYGPDSNRYLEELVREVNRDRPVDEQIGPWAVHTASPPRDELGGDLGAVTTAGVTLVESGFLGPSGKLRRRLVERHYRRLYSERELEVAQ